MSKKKISIKDVAITAGVSVSAVSAVLNNKVGKSIRVGKETQDKIWKAASKMGYVPNPAAQNLVSGRSNIVSVFTYEAIFPFAAESEFYKFLLGIEKQSEVAGYDLLLLTNRKFRNASSVQDEAALNRLKLGDGGILIGIERQTETISRLIDEGFPLVFIGRRDISGKPVNMVRYNYSSIIKRLIKLACEYGHKKSAYLRLKENTEPYEDRQKALDSALLECKSLINENLCFDDTEITPERIKQSIKEGVTLFLIERVSMALEMEKICNSLDIIIGKDLSMILFEDQWFSSDQNWTCWSDVRDKLGMEALNLLDELINKKIEKPKTILINPEIHYGESLKKL